MTVATEARAAVRVEAKVTATEVVRVVVAWATACEENASMVAAVGVGVSHKTRIEILIEIM